MDSTLIMLSFLISATISGSLALSACPKLELLRTCTTLSRGFYATSSERERVNAQIDALVESGSGLEDPTMGLAGQAILARQNSKLAAQGHSG